MSDVHHKPNQDSTTEDLRLQLASLQRTRSLAMWHDHSTVLQQGFILYEVKLVYVGVGSGGVRHTEKQHSHQLSLHDPYQGISEMQVS